MQKKGIKLELGVAEDIQKALNNGKTMLKGLDDALKAMQIADKGFDAQLKQADKAASNANKANDAANKLLMKVATTLEKAEKSAKDLGVDPKMVAGYSEADKMYNAIEEKRKVVNAFNWPIASKVSQSL